jgi:hypothetical protein
MAGVMTCGRLVRIRRLATLLACLVVVLAVARDTGRGQATISALGGGSSEYGEVGKPHSPSPVAAPHRLVVGAVEDGAKFGSPSVVMRLARSANLRAIVVSSVWRSPETTPDEPELGRLKAAVASARSAGITPIVAIYSFGSSTPLTDAARGHFVAYLATILQEIPGIRYVSVGNEPNAAQFWRPQFGPSGSDAAARAYFELLAEAYDVAKAVDPSVQVIGGSLAAHGSDRPGVTPASHSPTRFLRDLGAVFRASGRTRPIMDLFSIHPYPPNSSVPPTVADPSSTAIRIADYPRLVALLQSAFGHPIGIVYGEYGIQTRVPRWAAPLYSGAQPASERAVSDRRQAVDYQEAIALAACQPLVRMLFFFHVIDDPELSQMQTGLYYPNQTPKRSLVPVAASAAAAEMGEITCPGRSSVMAVNASSRR